MTRETKPLPTLISSKELVLNRIEALEKVRDKALENLADPGLDALATANAILISRTAQFGIQELRYFLAVCGL